MNALRALVFGLMSVGCGAVYPEVTAPVKAPPQGRALEPSPPSDLVFLAFARAEIPTKTRDGRQWDSIGGSAPDAFAKIIVDDVEIVRTPIESNTLKPTWPDQKLANYRLSSSAHVKVELWDSNPINNHPICVKNMPGLLEQVGTEPVLVDCESGAHVWLRVEPAHARWGLGFAYELRTGGAAVTRVFAESPAARAKIRPGDEILEIAGKRVAKMEEGEAQSLVNSNGQTGLTLLLRGEDKVERTVTFKEGPIYPVAEEGVPVQ